MLLVGDVADGEDVGRRRCAGRRRRGSRCRWRGRRRRRSRCSARRRHRRRPGRRAGADPSPSVTPPREMAVTCDLGAHVDAVVAMDLRQPRRDLGAEDAHERELQGLEHGDVRAGSHRGRGDLEPDPAAADDHDPTPLGEGGTEPVGVVERAQVGHLGVALVGQGEPPGPRTGGQHQLRVALLAGPGRHDVPRRVERRDAGAEPEVDVVLGVPLGGMHVGLSSARPCPGGSPSTAAAARRGGAPPR